MKKYAFANVKIPLEVLSNGNFELLREHIQVEFTPCTELPPKQSLNMDFTSILKDLFTQNKININDENVREIKIKNVAEENPDPEQVSDTDQEQDPEKESETTYQEQDPEKEPHQEPKSPQQMIILSNEIKTTKTNKKNTTFKNRKSSHNFTNKAYQ